MRRILALLLCVVLLVGCTKAEQSTSTSSATSQQSSASSTSSASSSSSGTATIAPPVLPQAALHGFDLPVDSEDDSSFAKVLHMWGDDIFYAVIHDEGGMISTWAEIFHLSRETGQKRELGTLYNDNWLHAGTTMPDGRYFRFVSYHDDDWKRYAGFIELDPSDDSLRYYDLEVTVPTWVIAQAALDDHTLLVLFGIEDIRHTYAQLASFDTNTGVWTTLYTQEKDIYEDGYVEMLGAAAIVNDQLLLFCNRVAEEDILENDFIVGPRELVVNVCDLRGNVLRRITSPGFELHFSVEVVGGLLVLTPNTGSQSSVWRLDGDSFTRLDVLPRGVDYPTGLGGDLAFPYIYLGFSGSNTLNIMDVRTGECSWLRIETSQPNPYLELADVAGNVCVQGSLYEVVDGEWNMDTRHYYIAAADIIMHMEPWSAGR